MQPAVHITKRVHADMRLGTLLTRIGLVSEADIVQDLFTAHAVGLPLGKILVIRQRITPSLLKLVIDAQWMIVDGVVNERVACRALQLAARNGWRLSDALLALGSDAFPKQPTRLGDLLIETHILNQDELAEELQIAALTGLPLGRVLVARGHLSEDTVRQAIRLQQSIRAETLNFVEATERLSLIYLTAEQNLKNGNKPHILASPPDTAAARQGLTFCDFLFLISYLDRDRLKKVVNRLGTDEDLLYGMLKRKPTGDRKFDIKAVLRDPAALTQSLTMIYPEDAQAIYCARAAYLSLEEGLLTAEEALVRYFEISREHRQK